MIARIARTGFVIGVVGGAIEPIAAGVKRFLLLRLVFVGLDFWWLAPLISGVLAAAASVIAMMAVRTVRPAWADRLRFLAPSVVVAANTLLLLPRLHPIVLVIGTSGLGFEVADWLYRWRAGFDTFARRAWIPLALLPLLFGLGSRAIIRIQDRSTGTVIADGAPNVLLVVFDGVRLFDVSAHGFEPDTTPFLRRLAPQGVRFDQAYSVSPWSGGGHGGMFTGHWADELSVTWLTSLSRTFPTLAETLSELGYRTGAVVADTEYASSEVLGTGFQFYSDYRLTPARLTTVTALERWLWTRGPARWWLTTHEFPDRVDADEVTEEFLRWLDRGAGQEHFFAFLNYMEAHAPYHPPKAYWEEFARPGEPYPSDVWALEGWSREEVDAQHRAYQASIKYLDSKFAELFDQLRRRGLLSNTLVIITSDHGEEFAEHGVMGHANSIHVEGLAVPLIMVWPGHLPAGRVIRTPVTTRQIPATIMDMLGQPARFPGPSLAPRWAADAADSPVTDDILRFGAQYAPNLPASYPVSHGPLSAVLQSGFWHLARADGQEQLYDAIADPRQLHDLAGDKNYRAVLDRMRSVHRSVAPALPIKER